MRQQMNAVGDLMRNLFVAHTEARTIIKQFNPDAQVGANPMLLGLPLWLQRIVDFNVTRLRSKEDLVAQCKRFTERAMLDKGQVDMVIATLSVTQERQEQVAFSEAYYIAEQTLLVKSQSSIQHPQDLTGQTVAVVKSTTAEMMVDQLLPSVGGVKVLPNYLEALRALDNQQVSAILSDDTILLGLIQQYPGQYRLLDDRISQEVYAVAVVKGDRELLNQVDIAVRQFKESGAWADSFSRYFPGQPVPPEPPRLGRRSTLGDITGRDIGHPIIPDQPLPKPLLSRIQKRGYLIVAIKDNVPGFGYRDPSTGEYSGLEIDLARAVAQRIFGDPNKVMFRPVKSEERLPLLRSMLGIFDPIQKIFGILSTSLTSNWWHLGMAGKLPTFLCPQECVGQQDFVGFDYYWGISNLRINRIKQLMDAAFGRYANAPVWSGVLYDMLKFHAKLFPGKEILIVENGCVDVADSTVTRQEYIRQHMREVQRACHEGVKVKGYVCWSMTSNREWGLKFDRHSDFGLYHIDLDTDPNLKRKPTTAAQIYQEIIEKRGV